MVREFKVAPAPMETQKAQRKSPQHAPRPMGHADQKPPPRSFGRRPRRIISALTGPGGQAPDQPRRKPLAKADGVIERRKDEGGRMNEEGDECR